MTPKVYFGTTAVIFTLVTLMHLVRIIKQWPLIVGTMTIPVWASWIGLIVGLILLYYGFKLAMKE